MTPGWASGWQADDPAVPAWRATFASGYGWLDESLKGSGDIRLLEWDEWGPALVSEINTKLAGWETKR